MAQARYLKHGRVRITTSQAPELAMAVVHPNPLSPITPMAVVRLANKLDSADCTDDGTDKEESTAGQPWCARFERAARCCGTLQPDSGFGLFVRHLAYRYPMLLAIWLMTAAVLPDIAFSDKGADYETTSDFFTAGTVVLTVVEWLFRVWATAANFPPTWLHLLPRLGWSAEARAVSCCAIEAIIQLKSTDPSHQVESTDPSHQAELESKQAEILESIQRVYKGRALLITRALYNAFDFFVCMLLVVSGVDSLFSFEDQTNRYQCFRLLMLFVRLPGIEGIIVSFFLSGSRVLSALFISIVWVFTFALIGHLWFGDYCLEDGNRVDNCGGYDYWSTLYLSMLTCMQMMTFDSWSSGIGRPLISEFDHSWLFFVGYVIMIGFIIMNMITGVVVDAITRAEDALQHPANGVLRSLALQDIFFNYSTTGKFLDAECYGEQPQTQPAVKQDSGSAALDARLDRLEVLAKKMMHRRGLQQPKSSMLSGAEQQHLNESDNAASGLATSAETEQILAAPTAHTEVMNI